MADEEVVEPSAAEQTQLETEARRSGWRPKEEWRGDPERWVDAKTFVERGREILPHVSHANEALRRENEQLRTQVAATQTEITELRGSVDGLLKFRQEVSQQQRNDRRAQLTAELAEARRAGDFEREAAIIEQLTRAPAREPERREPARGTNGSGATPPGGDSTPSRAIPQEMKDWVARNEWYSRDPVLQTAMSSVSLELRQKGELNGMSLSESLDYTAKEVLRRYAPAPTVRSGTEGGGRPAGGSAPGNSRRGEMTFADLPPDIQAECDAQGARLGLIGPNKVFKTKDEWRAHYIKETSRYAPNLPWRRERENA